MYEELIVRLQKGNLLAKEAATALEDLNVRIVRLRDIARHAKALQTQIDALEASEHYAGCNFFFQDSEKIPHYRGDVVALKTAIEADK